MSFLLFPCFAFLLLLMLSCAFLPFLAFRERRLAILKKRSSYDKSAIQIASLAFWLQIIIALALGADLLAKGVIDSMTRSLLRPLWQIQAVSWAGAAFLSFMAQQTRIRSRLGKGGQSLSHVCILASGLVSLFSALAFSLLLWTHLRCPAPEAGPVLNSGLEGMLALIKGSAEPTLLGLYLLTCLAAGATGAQALSQLWYLLRRRWDDFGRDYYSQVLAARARQASAVGGLLLLPCALGMMLFVPEFSAQRLGLLLPLAADYAVPLLTGLIACLPLAVICWHALARAELPLRRKSFVFLAGLLLWAWFYSLLARLWL